MNLSKTKMRRLNYREYDVTKGRFKKIVICVFSFVNCVILKLPKLYKCVIVYDMYDT